MLAVFGGESVLNSGALGCWLGAAEGLGCGGAAPI